MEKLLTKFLSFALLICLSFAQVPSYVRVCSRQDPNINQCVRTSIDMLRPKFKSGMPEFNLPTLDPLEIDDDLTLANSLHFKAHTRNVKIYGVSIFDLKNIDVNLTSQTIILDVNFNKLKIAGDYDIMARILVPITVVGPIELDAEDVNAKLTIRFKLVNNNGREHMFFTSTTCKITIRDYTSHYAPGTGQDRTIAEAINTVLNTSKPEIIASITSSLEKSVAKKVISVSNSITKKHTYDELLPNRI